MSRTATPAWRLIRRQALARAHEQGQTTCLVCRVPLDFERAGQPNSAEADHIISHALGGKDHLDNTRIICRTCNRRLGGKLGNQRSRARRPFTPKQPNTTAAW